MATFFAVPSQSLAVGSAKDRTNSNTTGGDVKVDVVQYTVPAGGLAIGDVLVWRDALPRGARVLPQSNLHWSAGAASSTVTLGDGAVANRYLTATAVTSAGAATANAAAASGGVYTVGTAANDQRIQSTVAGAALQAGQVITLVLYFVQ